jgi:outer membrane protein assembly factor BamB
VATPRVRDSEIWICDAEGRLHVLGLLTGLERRAASQTFAPHAAVVPAGRDLVLAVAGDRGLVALGAADLGEIWVHPAGVDAEPAVADLDGDGKLEVAVATRSGRLDVLDAATGRRLWGVALDGGPFEGGPAVADLDGDGVLDLLAASAGGRLFAVSGRPTRAARK